MADDQVCIGDRYRIGGAIFEVTQPRVTCFRVNWMDDPDARAADFPSPTRFYFRVLTEGTVEPGRRLSRLPPARR
jgi:MOSC domain-containing protein YiiM